MEHDLVLTILLKNVSDKGQFITWAHLLLMTPTVQASVHRARGQCKEEHTRC